MKKFGGTMDFWGFEGRPALPGEGFGLLMAGAPPPALPASPSPPPADPASTYSLEYQGADDPEPTPVPLKDVAGLDASDGIGDGDMKALQKFIEDRLGAPADADVSGRARIIREETVKGKKSRKPIGEREFHAEGSKTRESREAREKDEKASAIEEEFNGLDGKMAAYHERLDLREGELGKRASRALDETDVLGADYEANDEDIGELNDFIRDYSAKGDRRTAEELISIRDELKRIQQARQGLYDIRSAPLPEPATAGSPTPDEIKARLDKKAELIKSFRGVESSLGPSLSGSGGALSTLSEGSGGTTSASGDAPAPQAAPQRYVIGEDGQAYPIARTQSGGGYVNGANGLAQGIQATTGVVNSLAGLIGAGGNAGVAAQYTRGAWGGGGSAGFGYQDGSGNYSNGSVGPGGAYAGVGAYGDGSGGFTGIGGPGGIGDCGDMKRMARKIMMMLEQLLASICSGNMDAISSALNLCTLKAKTTLINASVHMIRASMANNQEREAITDEMGRLAGMGPQANAQMQYLGARFQNSSMLSQTITNNTKDIMGLVEEETNTQNGFQQKLERIRSAGSQWA